MSRKKGAGPRNAQHPKPVLTGADDELALNPGTIVHPLTGESRRLLDAILTGRAILIESDADELIDFDDDESLEDDHEHGHNGQSYGDDPDDELYPEIDAEIDAGADGEFEGADPAGALDLTTRVLARALIAQAIGRTPAHAATEELAVDSFDDPLMNAAVLDTLAESLLQPNAPPLPPRLGPDRELLIEDVAELIAEVGLEEFDALCDLEIRRDGTSTLYATPISPEHAHVALLDLVYGRAESVVAVGDDLLGFERDASSWEFGCWNVAPPAPMGQAVASYASAIREQEYSLVDRVSSALGMSVVEDLMSYPDYAEAFPRQYHMARALSTSVADIYECLSITGDRVTLRSLSDGETFTVAEHMRPIPYTVGWLAFGRLLRFNDEGLHVRSLGMFFAKPPTPDTARKAADALREFEEVLPNALALEAVISSVVVGVNVPRRDKPFRTRADARHTLDALREIFAGTEWERLLTPASSASAESTHVSGAPQYYVPRQKDMAVDGFVTALIAQAEAGGANEERTRAQRPKQHRRWR
jgi:hypothetical protein